MAVIERTRAYETLIRHNADGSIAAHHMTISEVLRDGVVIAATLNSPEPVAGAAFDVVLGAALNAALGQVSQLQALIVQQAADLAVLRAAAVSPV